MPKIRSKPIAMPAEGWNIQRLTTHPGEMLLEEFLRPLDLSANRVALDLHVPVTRITEILHGRRSITADTALRLGRYFEISPESLDESAEVLRVEQGALGTPPRYRKGSAATHKKRCVTPLPLTSN